MNTGDCPQILQTVCWLPYLASTVVHKEYGRELVE